jgi:hypothetical protein
VIAEKKGKSPNNAKNNDRNFTRTSFPPAGIRQHNKLFVNPMNSSNVNLPASRVK